MNKTLLLNFVFLFSIYPTRAQVAHATTKPPAIETQSAQLNSTLPELGDLPLRTDLPDDPVPKKPVDGDQPCPAELEKPSVVATGHFYATDPFLTARPKRNRVADKKFWTVFGVSVGSSLLATKAGIDCRHRNGVEACSMGYGAFRAFEVVRMVFSTLVWPPAGYAVKKWDQEDGRKPSAWWILPTIGIGINAVTAAREFNQGCKKGPRLANGKCPD